MDSIRLTNDTLQNSSLQFEWTKGKVVLEDPRVQLLSDLLLRLSGHSFDNVIGSTLLFRPW